MKKTMLLAVTLLIGGFLGYTYLQSNQTTGGAEEAGVTGGGEVFGVQSSVCGDGVMGLNEQCDDGNISDGDGCSAGCELEYSLCNAVTFACEYGVINQGNYGNVGCNLTTSNDMDGDGFVDACDPQTCGNLQVEGTEECDDANDNNDDACSNDCELTDTGDDNPDDTNEQVLECDTAPQGDVLICNEGGAISENQSFVMLDSCVERSPCSYCVDANQNAVCDAGEIADDEEEENDAEEEACRSVGESCNDGDSSTENDKVNEGCECEGEATGYAKYICSKDSDGVFRMNTHPDNQGYAGDVQCGDVDFSAVSEWFNCSLSASETADFLGAECGSSLEQRGDTLRNNSLLKKNENFGLKIRSTINSIRSR